MQKKVVKEEQGKKRYDIKRNEIPKANPIIPIIPIMNEMSMG